MTRKHQIHNFTISHAPKFSWRWSIADGPSPLCQPIRSRVTRRLHTCRSYIEHVIHTLVFIWVSGQCPLELSAFFFFDNIIFLGRMRIIARLRQ